MAKKYSVSDMKDRRARTPYFDEERGTGNSEQRREGEGSEAQKEHARLVGQEFQLPSMQNHMIELGKWGRSKSPIYAADFILRFPIFPAAHRFFNNIDSRLRPAALIRRRLPRRELAL